MKEEIVPKNEVKGGLRYVKSFLSSNGSEKGLGPSLEYGTVQGQEVEITERGNHYAINGDETLARYCRGIMTSRVPQASKIIHELEYGVSTLIDDSRRELEQG